MKSASSVTKPPRKWVEPIDVVIESRGPSLWYIPLALGLIILATGLIGLYHIISRNLFSGFIVGLVLSGIGALPLGWSVLHRRRLEAPFCQAVRADPRHALRNLLKRGAEYSRLSFVNLFGHHTVMDVIARCGLRGQAIRLGSRPELLEEPVCPLTITFEPLPLDEADRGFAELAAPPETLAGQPGPVNLGQLRKAAVHRALMGALGIGGLVLTPLWLTAIPQLAFPLAHKPVV